jgi:hypothetical protein
MSKRPPVRKGWLPLAVLGSLALLQAGYAAGAGSRAQPWDGIAYIAMGPGKARGYPGWP